MSQLFNKYHVRTPDEQPLDAGCFVLRPFNSDGSVRDPAAVAALKSYANFLPATSAESVEKFKAFSSRLRADLGTGSILEDV